MFERRSDAPRLISQRSEGGNVPELAYLNGTFSPISEAKVSIEDRGFQFGDSIYEVIFAYGGKLFELDAHLTRLRTSLEAIDLCYDFEADGLVEAIREGVRRCEFSDVMVYLQVTRGVAPRNHTIPDGITPTVVITFKAIPPIPPELHARGARLKTFPETRWANCYIKATTLLPNVLAKSRAKRAGYDDAIFVTDQGEVRESTSANIYVVEGKTVIYPQRDKSVLHGITQRFLGGCMEAIGVRAEEGLISLDRLFQADEVFISSTAVEVLAVTSVDGKAIAKGEVGPITHGLYEEFRRRTRL